VAFSGDVPPGRVLRRKFAGEEVVLYRTRRGLLRVVKPYCPHLGAHLGVGGKVVGEDLVCPFHKFAFNPDGICVGTAYGTRPPRASLEQLPAREVNGAVLLWHHAEGDPPSWEVPDLAADGFPAPARHVTTMVAHPQEVIENSIDIGHFGPVHGTSGAEITKPMEPDGPRLSVGTSVFRVLPVLGRSDVAFDVQAHGLGYLRVLANIPQWKLSALVQIMPVAIDPWRVQARFTVSARLGSSGSRAQKYAGWLATQIFAQPSWRGIEQDVPIWRHKIHVAHPRLALGDGPIMRFRGWASQFYSVDPDKYSLHQEDESF
jgi:nitrite reductase/ring-hydroxylating ferredoxin subunit